MYPLCNLFIYVYLRLICNHFWPLCGQPRWTPLRSVTFSPDGFWQLGVFTFSSIFDPTTSAYGNNNAILQIASFFLKLSPGCMSESWYSVCIIEQNKSQYKLPTTIIRITWSLKKINHSIFEYLIDKVGLQAMKYPLETPFYSNCFNC